MMRRSTFVVLAAAAIAAGVAGCSKEDIEAAREAGTNAVSQMADKTLEISGEARGVVERTTQELQGQIREQVAGLPEEAARKASEMLDAAGEDAKNAGDAISGHAASLKEELEARAGRGEK